jgi:hypothetical protein
LSTRAELITAYEKKLNRQRKLSTDLADIKALLSLDCKHEQTYESKEANDNGYGRWWYVHFKVCKFCGHKEVTHHSEYRL